MNKVILLGRLTRDPEIRYTQSGKQVATFSVAVDRGYSRQYQENQSGPTADFIPVVVWDKQADFVKNFFTKGKSILVEGRIQVRSFEGQDGNKRTFTEVVASHLEFTGSKAEQGGGGGSYYNAAPAPSSNYSAPAPSTPAQSPSPQSAPETLGPPIPDEDIPF